MGRSLGCLHLVLGSIPFTTRSLLLLALGDHRRINGPYPAEVDGAGYFDLPGALHAGGRWFEPGTAHHRSKSASAMRRHDDFDRFLLLATCVCELTPAKPPSAASCFRIGARLA